MNDLTIELERATYYRNEWQKERALNAELLALLQRAMPYVSMGWEADDCDVYGIHGNDVGDWQQEAEAAIARATAL